MNNKKHSSTKETLKRLFAGTFSVFLILTLISPAWAVVFTNPAAITINDATIIGIGNPYPSNITVSGLTGNTTNVTLRLENINHTFPDDLDILLVSPSGGNLIVLSDIGGAEDINFGNITIDDAAANSIPDGTAFASGSFKPTNIGTGDTFPAPAPAPGTNTTLAAAFNGSSPNGAWSLYVVDDLGVDQGSIGNGWSLTVTTDGSPATTFRNSTAIGTGDGAKGRATPYNSTITATGLTGAITDVNVTLTNLNHLNPDDLDIMLIAPSGKRIVLLSDAGGTVDAVAANVTFDDAAAAVVPDAGPLVTATVRPTNFGTGDTFPDYIPAFYNNSGTAGNVTLASAFNGTEGNGVWRLVIVDDATANAGDLTGGWSIDITAGGTYGAKRFTSSDFDGDGQTDNGVFRPSNNFWYLRDSNLLTVRYTNFGATGDILVPADYDGDRRHDLAVFRPASGQWITLNSATGTFSTVQFGVSTDKAVPADYDGDGRYDIAVWRPSNGAWYVRQSNNGSPTLRTVVWGANGDVPVRGHFNGTNGADFTVYRPSNNTWYINNNANSAATAVTFGTAGDSLTPGDYDGDGRTDVAVWRPSNGAWYILRSSDSSFFGITWGANGDVAAPGDFDGDTRTDVAVWRPATGTWYIINSGTAIALGGTVTQRIDNWGLSGDLPLAATYLIGQ